MTFVNFFYSGYRYYSQRRRHRQLTTEHNRLAVEDDVQATEVDDVLAGENAAADLPTVMEDDANIHQILEDDPLAIEYEDAVETGNEALADDPGLFAMFSNLQGTSTKVVKNKASSVSSTNRQTLLGEGDNTVVGKVVQENSVVKSNSAPLPQTIGIPWHLMDEPEEYEIIESGEIMPKEIEHVETGTGEISKTYDINPNDEVQETESTKSGEIQESEPVEISETLDTEPVETDVVQESEGMKTDEIQDIREALDPEPMETGEMQDTEYAATGDVQFNSETADDEPMEIDVGHFVEELNNGVGHFVEDLKLGDEVPIELLEKREIQSSEPMEHSETPTLELLEVGDKQETEPAETGDTQESEPVAPMSRGLKRRPKRKRRRQKMWLKMRGR